jgi:hypothetical protein
VDLAADQQAGLVLLRDPEDLRRAVLLSGGAGDRHPADLVRVDPGAADLRGVVAGAPGLAGGRGAPGFYFYGVVFDPFLVIGITLCIGLLVGSARAAPARRAMGAVLSGAYLLAVLTDFYYMYPVLTAQVIPYSSWFARMWYHGWI